MGTPTRVLERPSSPHGRTHHGGDAEMAEATPPHGDGRADGGGADSSSANSTLTPEHGDEPRARGGDPEGEEDAELHATIDCGRMSIAHAHVPWIQMQSSSDEARI